MSHLVKEDILLSFVFPMGDMENSIIGQTGNSPAKLVTW